MSFEFKNLSKCGRCKSDPVHGAFLSNKSEIDFPATGGYSIWCLMCAMDMRADNSIHVYTAHDDPKRQEYMLDLADAWNAEQQQLTERYEALACL